MRLIACAAAIMLTGLGLLLAMVVRLVEPSLALSLVSYATTFVGMMVGLAGVTSGRRSRR